MNEILGIYLKNKHAKHPLTKEPLSKEKRIESLFNVVQNRVYDKTYSIEQRILASELITQILKEGHE